MDSKRYLVTAALPYANGPLHIGHLAGCYLPSDIYVRYLKACRKEVIFLCGSDEHGVPITIRAMKEGVSPQAIVDRYDQVLRHSFEQMGIAFDYYGRTSSAIHRETSQEIFLQLHEKGLFEEKVSDQLFDEEKQVFLADRYVVGTCPVCSYEKAYGDQCEKCGTSLSPDQLIHPRSALSDSVPVRKPTRHWYFPLDQYQDWLKEWILESKKGEWKPNVYGQCKSWLDQGLQPRAMTRDGQWGVPVPIEGAENKVLYVWFDAPIGYISATRAYLPQRWKEFWQNENTELVHFIGKDNIVFHCIIFPAMLKALGSYVLPRQVPANEFLNIEGEKVSTSRNWAVWVHEYLEAFPDGQDVLRYVLCANAPEAKDNDFTWKDFQDRNNNELVAILGNFVNRTMVLMHKLCDGRVPAYHETLEDALDQELKADLAQAKERISAKIESFHFREALFEVMELARKGNRYLQIRQPWILAKSLDHNPENQKAIDHCLHLCLQLTANLAIFLNPFLPFTAKKICHMLKVVDRMLDWENAGRWDLVRPRYPLRPPQLLFRKIEDQEIQAQRDKLHAALSPSPDRAESTDSPPSVPPFKPEVAYDDFSKMDLRTGRILTAKKMEKADKLLELQVDLGSETRTIVSGIALHYSPEDLVGKQVLVLANLAPRKLRGVLSQGMILMAEDGEGRLIMLGGAEDTAPGLSVS